MNTPTKITAPSALSEQRAIAEMRYLLAIPGVRESIMAGMAESVESCTTTLDWSLPDNPSTTETPS